MGVSIAAGRRKSQRRCRSRSVQLRASGARRAGFPARDALAVATSRVTTLPAPITAPSPMVTPGRMMAPPPIQTSLPIRTGRPNSRPSRRVFGVARMVGGVDLHRGPDLGAVADPDFDDVEDDAVEIHEHAVAETDVVAEVAKERRPDHGIRADMAEALAKQRVPFRHRQPPAPHCSAPATPCSHRLLGAVFRRRGRYSSPASIFCFSVLLNRSLPASETHPAPRPAPRGPGRVSSSIWRTSASTPSNFSSSRMKPMKATSSTAP